MRQRDAGISAFVRKMARREGETMVKRSLLYLRRKYKRSVLLFLLLFVISFSLAVGVTVWNSIGAVTKEVQDRLGTSFIFKQNAAKPEDPSLYGDVQMTDGTWSRIYTGPLIGQNVVEQVMGIDGVSAYNGEDMQYADVQGIELVAGMWHDAVECGPVSNEPEDVAYYEQCKTYLQMTTLYGNTDTSLYSKFRTGSFTLTNGRHITPEDEHVVLISDKLAEMNGLQVGDVLQVAYNATLPGQTEQEVIATQELQIVGLFHVNGYQPLDRNVAESDISYNWLLTDNQTLNDFSQTMYERFYVDWRRDPAFLNITFFVDDPAQLQSIVEQAWQLDIAQYPSFDIAVDDTMYRSTVEPLQSIRNLVAVATLVIAIGCALVLVIIFTMWIKSRKREIAIYLSLGIRKSTVFGQFILEAGMVLLLAMAVTMGTCRNVPDMIGNHLLASAVEQAQPQEIEYSLEDLREAARRGEVSGLLAYQDSTYGGPDHIDFSFRLADFLMLLALELLIIVAAICKGGSFIFKLQPKQILTTMR